MVETSNGNETSQTILSAQGSFNIDTENPNQILDINDIAGDNEAENPYCSKKRKRTSKAWNDFKEVTEKDGSIKAECIHCKHKLAINKNGATTQFHRHLKSCIRRQINLKGQQELSITSTIAESESVSAVQNFKYDQAKIREVMSHMIMVHELPFLFVEYDLFNLLMRTATPHYQKVSCTTIRKDCFTSYELEKKKVLTLLKSANRVSVTTDLWKSTNQKISYMVITCHFVDSNWNLQKRTLNFCDVPPPHNGLAICDVLHKCLTEWGIEDKVWTVTVDNASYNDVAVRLLKENLSYKNQLPLSGKLFHVRCCAHILNLLVQDGLSEITDIIKNVRESVKHIANSESRLIMFGEISKQLKLSSKHLILDCCTRWNATYFMLSAALEFKDVFPRYQQRDPTYVYLPSVEDWKKVAEVCSFLEEFNQVTQIISGTEYPTSNLFLSELYVIKRLLNEKSMGEEDFMKSMVKKMKDKFDKYWGNCNLLISMAAVLDPRYKMQFIEWCFPLIYSRDDCIEHIMLVRETLRMLYKEYLESYRTNNVEAQGENSKESSSTTRTIGIGKARGKDEFRNYIRNVEAVFEQVKSELDVYLEEGVMSCEDDSVFNVLDWWKMNTLKFRILSRMACDILSIPITTVASESAFSAGSRVIDQYRASLGADTTQVLLCGEDWFRAFYGIKRKRKDKEDIKEFIIP